MRFLLDANAVIALLRGEAGLTARITAHRPADFGLPAIVAQELVFGAFRSRRPEHHLARVEALRFETVEFDREDARIAGELRARLAAAGTPIGPYDVLIAAQAMARDLVLITHNAREFSRAPGLRFEDWER